MNRFTIFLVVIAVVIVVATNFFIQIEPTGWFLFGNPVAIWD